MFLLDSPATDEDDDAIDVLDDDEDKEMLSEFGTRSTTSSTTSISSSEIGSSLITLVGSNSSTIVILSTFETVNDKYNKNNDNKN